MTFPDNKKGFTLLELLLVIGIIAGISAVLVAVIDPAEKLRETRDLQRMADLNTLKKAIVKYIASTQNPIMDGVDNSTCVGGSGTKLVWISATSTPPATAWHGVSAMHQPGPVETVGNVDGMGWLPINFTSISGGSPISNLPVDPTNFINGGSQNVGQANLHYHYACRYPSFGFELMVLMESNQYKTIDNKAENDGGDDSMSYEVGTDLRILPANSFFTI